VITRGGDPKYAGSNIATNFNAWSGSVKDFPVMIDFVDNRSLIPIWELVQDAEKRAKLQSAYPAFCAAKAYKYEHRAEQYLVGRYVALHKIYDDHGTHAKKDVSFARPETGDQWHYLGWVAYPGKGGAVGEALIVKELVRGALADITGWDQVWSDHGSGNRQNFYTWKANASNPTEYKVLGDFFTHLSATKPDISGMKAVHEHCLARGKIGAQIWNDHGTGANQDGSLWEVLPENDSGISIRAFMASGTKNGPAQREIFVLKKSAIFFESPHQDDPTTTDHMIKRANVPLLLIHQN